MAREGMTLRLDRIPIFVLALALATAANGEVRPMPTGAEADALMTAIVKKDSGKAAEYVRSGKSLDFNFDIESRGRTSQSPLTVAAGVNNPEMVRIFLDGGADLRRRDGFGATAMGAARTPEMVRLLAERGADPNAQGLYDETPLVAAAEKGNLVLIDALLAAGARFDAPYRPPDLFARLVGLKKTEMIGEVLKRGADPRAPPTKALAELIERGDAANAALLLKHGADPDAIEGVMSALSRALFRRQWSIAEALVDAGARLDAPDRPGCEKPGTCDSTFLARSAAFDPPLLAKLKQRGLNLDRVNPDGQTALTSLIVERPLSVQSVSGGAVIPPPDNAARARAVLAAGADPNRKTGSLTPLMLAIMVGDRMQMEDAIFAAGGRVEFDGTIPALQELTARPLPGGLIPSGAYNAPAQALDNGQGTRTGMRVGPLGWALLVGRPAIARGQLDRDRRIEAADRNVLYFAAEHGEWELLLEALRYTREANASNRADVTPLMFAANAGRSDAVRALLAAGANVNARSARTWPPLADRKLLDELGAAFAGHSSRQPLPPLVGGFTALGLARQRGNPEVARILGDAGGRE
jgi:ankyrin repeat protein